MSNNSIRRLGSRSVDQWQEIEVNNARRVGSRSRDQWERINDNNLDTPDKNATNTAPKPVSPLQSTKELDYALNLNTEREPSEATAVTGNISWNSKDREGGKVTPDNSPDSRGRHGGSRKNERSRSKNSSGSKGSRGSKDGRNNVTPGNSPDDRGRRRRESDKSSSGRGNEQNETTRDSTKNNKGTKLIMCGAIDVTEEMRGSLQDVNASIRQIYSTVRRFGPEEKDAVRETVRDAKEALKKSIRSAVSCRGK